MRFRCTELPCPLASASWAYSCNGQIVGQPRKQECRQNVRKCRKMSGKCPKIVQRGCKHNFRTFFGQFLPIWSMLLFGDPVQCTPVTSLLPLQRVWFQLGCRKWGCNKWGLKGCLTALPGNRPKSAFFALFLPFSPFSGGCEEHLGNPENGGKRPFSSDILSFA